MPDNARPNGLDADADAARLLRSLAWSVLGVSLALTALLFFENMVLRPAALTAVAVGFIMLVMVRAGRLRLAAHMLCWGLLLSGTLGVYLFGLALHGNPCPALGHHVWRLVAGRSSAIALAVAASSVSLWVYVEYLQGHVRSFPPTMQADALAHVAIFSVTALLAGAMAATLRRQYNHVSALADRLQEANATLESRVAERSAQWW